MSARGDDKQTTTEIVSRKATYVMETIMQAADVSHTMQPFNVFKKWNHMLYREMYAAFKAGRAENDPTDGWYRGEFGFFDFYIIPLARKLLDCGVLERSKVENLLDNAIANRKEWEIQGEEIVRQYVAEMKIADVKETLSGFKFLTPNETKESMESGNLHNFLEGMNTPKGSVDTNFLPL